MTPKLVQFCDGSKNIHKIYIPPLLKKHILTPPPPPNKNIKKNTEIQNVDPQMARDCV